MDSSPVVRPNQSLWVVGASLCVLEVVSLNDSGKQEGEPVNPSGTGVVHTREEQPWFLRGKDVLAFHPFTPIFPP